MPALPAASVFTTGGPSISISTMLGCSCRAQHGAMRSPTWINSEGSVRVRAEHRKTESEARLHVWWHTTTTGTDCRTVGCILLMGAFYMSQLQ